MTRSCRLELLSLSARLRCDGLVKPPSQSEPGRVSSKAWPWEEHAFVFGGRQGDAVTFEWGTTAPGADFDTRAQAASESDAPLATPFPVLDRGWVVVVTDVLMTSGFGGFASRNGATKERSALAFASGVPGERQESRSLESPAPKKRNQDAVIRVFLRRATSQVIIGRLALQSWDRETASLARGVLQRRWLRVLMEQERWLL